MKKGKRRRADDRWQIANGREHTAEVRRAMAEGKGKRANGRR